MVAHSAPRDTDGVLAPHSYYDASAVAHERVAFPFAGPKNVGLVSEPPAIHQEAQTDGR
jgi:hypothetical protein